MTVTLSLGGVVFQGFEIPETINFGGDQKLVVHKLPGGGRVIDSMGPDDADIRWSGRLRGSGSEERGMMLDYMRRQGRRILLAWSLHRYQVVIHTFEANYQNPYEIPYSIACTVVLDESQALASVAVGFAESLAADLADAVGLGNLLGRSDISAAVEGVSAALSNLQAGAPSATNLITAGAALTETELVSGLLASVTGAQAVVGSAINTTTSGLGTSLPSPGGSASSMAAALTEQAAGFGNLNNLHRLSGSLGRMAINTSNYGN
jgi:hypothetical protein